MSWWVVMGDRIHAAWAWIVRSFLQIFPLPLRGTATEFAEACVTDPAAVSNIQVAEDAIAKATDEVASELADRAREMLQQEDQRQASVMGRAQSLFFAVALLSSLLSIGAGFLVSSRTPHIGELLFISALALFLVIQVTLLVLSLARAISGLIYPRAGASDFARWAGCGGVGQLHRDEIISVLRWYRLSAHINTWRFSCLERALRALRNVVIGSGLLVLAVLVFANIPSRQSCTDKTEFREGVPVRYSIECPIERVGQH
jgi:hypothetical protein